MTFADLLRYAAVAFVGVATGLGLARIVTSSAEAFDNGLHRIWNHHGWCYRCGHGSRFRRPTYEYEPHGTRATGERRHYKPLPAARWFHCLGCTVRQASHVAACAAILGFLVLWVLS